MIQRQAYCIVVWLAASSLAAAEPPARLKTVFPCGAQAGQSTRVVLAGHALGKVTAVRSTHPGIVFEKAAPKKGSQENAQGDSHGFFVKVAADTPVGLYDIQAMSDHGVSSSRTFFVSRRPVRLDVEPNDTAGTAQQTTVDVVISGKIEKGGDVDQFRFSARRGQRLVIECWAERIDSSLRAVLEVYDKQGKRLASNRGYFGVDPLICFQPPNDGEFIVRLYDLVYSGSENHFYRLDIGLGPRVVFTTPSVVQKGKSTQVTLWGWNLQQGEKPAGFESRVVTVQLDDSPSRQSSGKSHDSESRATVIHDSESRATVFRRPYQTVLDGFAYHLAGADAPVPLTVTDAPVVLDRSDNHSPSAAQPISVPCEVSGQLAQGEELDWFSIEARRGEVWRLESWGQRIGSPIDLDVSVLDASGKKELARFRDELGNIGGKRFPTNHLDAAGRFVAPADGKYLILVRNLIGGLDHDPRRVYRLSVRREEFDMALAAVSPQKEIPAPIQLRRGGRAVVDVLAFRRRGLEQSIRVSAHNLPPGVSCPDIWLGPGVTCAPLVLTAEESASELVSRLELVGHVNLGGVELSRRVKSGTMIREGLPNGAGRLTFDTPFAVGKKAPLLVTALCRRSSHQQGAIVDVEVDVQRRPGDSHTEVILTGVGLPAPIRSERAVIAAGQNKGVISFYLPSTLAVGRYTIVIQANTTAVLPESQSNKPAAFIAFSNPISFEVTPAPFFVELDLNAPRKIRRGQVVQVNYTAKRKNGFIGKIHTELAAPGNVVGLRARGVTFVGQTESGTIQIIANKDAPLGRQPFLRFEAVGTVEDQPVYHGGCFLPLEIVE